MWSRLAFTKCRRLKSAQSSDCSCSFGSYIVLFAHVFIYVQIWQGETSPILAAILTMALFVLQWLPVGSFGAIFPGLSDKPFIFSLLFYIDVSIRQTFWLLVACLYTLIFGGFGGNLCYQVLLQMLITFRFVVSLYCLLSGDDIGIRV